MAKGKRGRPPKNGWDKKLDAWESAWERTDKSVPMPLAVDSALAELGSGAYALRIECARCAIIPTKDRSKTEQRACDLYARTMSAQHAVLQERMMGHPAGQMHIAKCLHGMRDVQQVEIHGKSLEEALNG